MHAPVVHLKELSEIRISKDSYETKAQASSFA